MPDEAMLSRMAVDPGRALWDSALPGSDCAHWDNYRPLSRAVFIWAAG